MRNFKLFLLVFLLTGSSIYSQNPSSFYPIQIGNKYVYQHWDLMFNCNPVHFLNYRIVQITSDTVFSNGKKYYKFSGYWDSRYIYQRVDTNSWNVYFYDRDSTSEFLLDSLLAHTGDHFNGRRNPAGYGVRPVLYSEGSYNYFGQVRDYKNIFADGILVMEYTLVDGIGLMSSGLCELGGGESYILKGCVLNGIVLGDTTLTAIQNISTNLPDKFVLHDNYPNPFNPATTIEFETPVRGPLKISIYDAVGREVIKLVDDVLNPGVYRVSWDASVFSSGVFFYRMEGEGFVQSKKMLLIK